MNNKLSAIKIIFAGVAIAVTFSFASAQLLAPAPALGPGSLAAASGSSSGPTYPCSGGLDTTQNTTWLAPSSAPSDTSNSKGPIDVSTTPQSRCGGLLIGISTAVFDYLNGLFKTNLNATVELSSSSASINGVSTNSTGVFSTPNLNVPENTYIGGRLSVGSSDVAIETLDVSGETILSNDTTGYILSEGVDHSSITDSTKKAAQIPLCVDTTGKVILCEENASNGAYLYDNVPYDNRHYTAWTPPPSSHSYTESLDDADVTPPPAIVTPYNDSLLYQLGVDDSLDLNDSTTEICGNGIDDDNNGWTDNSESCIEAGILDARDVLRKHFSYDDATGSFGSVNSNYKYYNHGNQLYTSSSANFNAYGLYKSDGSEIKLSNIDAILPSGANKGSNSVTNFTVPTSVHQAVVEVWGGGAGYGGVEGSRSGVQTGTGLKLCASGGNGQNGGKSNGWVKTKGGSADQYVGGYGAGPFGDASGANGGPAAWWGITGSYVLQYGDYGNSSKVYRSTNGALYSGQTPGGGAGGWSDGTDGTASHTISPPYTQSGSGGGGYGKGVLRVLPGDTLVLSVGGITTSSSLVDGQGNDSNGFNHFNSFGGGCMLMSGNSLSLGDSLKKYGISKPKNIFAKAIGKILDSIIPKAFAVQTVTSLGPTTPTYVCGFGGAGRIKISWETGPLSFSDGFVDPSVNPDSVCPAFASDNLISASSTNNSAEEESGDIAELIITRTKTTSDTTVLFTISGTATFGSDYTLSTPTAGAVLSYGPSDKKNKMFAFGASKAEASTLAQLGGALPGGGVPAPGGGRQAPAPGGQMPGGGVAVPPTKLKIPAGASSAVIRITPMDDTNCDGNSSCGISGETVVLNIESDPSGGANPYVVSSSTATATISDNDPEYPIITAQPISDTFGSSGTFSVSAVGEPSLTYQWQKSYIDQTKSPKSKQLTTVNISGETGSTFATSNVLNENSDPDPASPNYCFDGTKSVCGYSVVVTDVDGNSITSNLVTFTPSGGSGTAI